MGTSGSYGGSGQPRWNRVRDLAGGVSGEGGGDSPPSDGGGGDSPPVGDVDVEDQVAQAIGDALAGDDPALVRPLQSIPIESLVASFARRGPSGGGGGGGAGGVVTGGSRTTGRTGAGSTRQILRGASRGGTAIAGAYALRYGDADGLAGLGLDLDQLRTLSPRMQCARILDAILGDAGHPDDFALRQAAAEQIKAIVLGETPPEEPDALRGFIASYVFRLCIVEIRAALVAGSVDANAAAAKENRIRDWISRRIRGINLPTSGRMSVTEFKDAAGRVAAEAIRILRAGQ